MSQPDTIDSTETAAIDQIIVRAAIHPGIGVARIGDSKTEYFIGPETVTPPAHETYRDAAGAIKRQAARFRLYGYNAAGQVVRELTPDDAEIVWTAHLANRKAQWYQFQYALDIPEAVNAPDNQFPLRNSKIVDRTTLAIDPGPRSISGRDTGGGPDQSFDTGTFQADARKPVTVPLGELRTDACGRLIVLGGTGVSASPTDAPVFDPARPPSFNNADDWYDDTSDGPVTATVSIQGRAIPVEGAWVVVAPPDYAPGVLSWRTMYDLMSDVFVRAGWMTMPDTPSFARDMLPILSRLSGLQWVNKGFAAYFGKGGAMDFTDPAFVAKLSHRVAGPPGDDPYAELRLAILHNFRPGKPIVAEPIAWPHVWPWIYGDAFGSFPETGTGNMLPMTGLQEALLRRWAAGQFVDDWPAQAPAAAFDAVPLADQPATLDRAALDYCLADTFHPGCEMTWPMRHASLYSAPFRIRARPADQPEPNYGTVLTPVTVAAVDGPLYAQPPGGLTRWMALPWQGDTAFCRSGYNPDFDPYLPTFWAARVPNQVLTAADYDIVMDTARPRAERLAAYHRRENWLRAIDNADTAQVMLRMVAHFGQLGIVEARPGIADDPDFPDVIHVETLVAGKLRKGALKATAVLQTLDRPRTQLEKAGWASHEQFEAFRAVRVRRS